MNCFSSVLGRTLLAIAQDVHKRCATIGLVAAALLAGMSSPVFAVNPDTTSYPPFSSRTITTATQYPAGTVLATDSLTPTQLCNASSCTLVAMQLYNRDSYYTGGPNLATEVQGIAFRILANGKPLPSSSTTITLTTSLVFQLIATGDPIIAGQIGASSSPSYAVTTLDRGASLPALVWYFFPKATIKTQSCSVPNQTITLPSVSSGNFSGLGTTSGAQNFSITLQNCPAGVSRVGYSLTPVGSETTGYAGTLPLGSGSTATGVRIRVTDTNGTPVTFNTSNKLTAYNPATGGSYSVSFQASYIQTGASVKPGSVSGSMQVLVDYQ
ncbi:fimbrial protein [Paraburkholderia lycopersici]|uniref:Pilin (Type 1 fimbria component protein) n=1 Tax=Paraburkholderia lycopersici TaxID=416944 RepID=A0A1G6RCB8_9BURK|nr:fimbrial protein [Paraburkholderia lycopersici]SDD02081.1 Pilin (type 1 fimbria component protein) [Paraburkholderia lycopersici]